MENKKFTLLLTTLSLLLITSCENNTIPTSEFVPVTDISIKGTGYDEGEVLYIERGNTVTLAGSVVPSYATDRLITYESDNYDIPVENIGNNQCVITAYNLGEATIKATVGTFTKEIDVECIDKILPTSIEVETNTIDLQVTQRAELNFEILPANASNKRISTTIIPVGDSEPDKIKIIEENSKYYVQNDGGGDPGDSYEITIRSVAAPTVSAKVTVNLVDYPVESMKFQNENVTISLKDPVYKMLPTFKPDGTSQYYATFESDNPDICDIDDVGRLIPKKVGKATVRAINIDNPEVSCETTVTVTNDETEYLFRGLKKSDVTNLEVENYTYMDFEFDKTAFSAWSENRWFSEDTNLQSSHISDAGWAIWLVGFDTYDDDNYVDGAETNVLIYCKLHVPENATEMQYIFRSHQTSNDYAKFRIKAVDEELNVYDMTDSWITFHRADDMWYNIDVTKFQGQDITFVLEQDQMGIKKELETDKVGVSLMFRRCLFNTPENEELWNTSIDYSIIEQNKQEGVL